MSTFPGQNLAVANLNASETQGRSRAEEASALFPVRQLLQIMPPRRRLPVIGVMGSGKAAHEDLVSDETVSTSRQAALLQSFMHGSDRPPRWAACWPRCRCTC